MWFKVDDTLAFHEKTVSAGNAAMGLWVRAGAWSSQMLSDGVIPSHMVLALGAIEEAERLVECGLWVTHERGYQFHGWEEFQFTKEEIEAKRTAERDRKRTQRMAGYQATSRSTTGQFQKVSPLVSHQDTDRTPEVVGDVSTATRPVPSRPVPLHTANAKPDAGASEEFDAFWDLYPRKLAVGQARKAWKSAMKKTDAATVMDSIRASIPVWAEKDISFTPHASTWLNGERWNDVLDSAPARGYAATGKPEGW